MNQCVEAPGGIFVEQATDDDAHPWLTDREMSLLSAVRSCCSWEKIGFETGRERGYASFKADMGDMDILSPRAWRLGESCPGPEWHVWAVEIAFPGTLNYIRRRFWFASLHVVPPAELEALSVEGAGG